MGRLLRVMGIVAIIDILSGLYVHYFPILTAILSVLQLSGKEITELAMSAYLVFIFAFAFDEFVQRKGEQ